MSLYYWNPEKVREMYNKLIELSHADTGSENILNMSGRITEPIVSGEKIMNTFGVSGIRNICIPFGIPHFIKGYEGERLNTNS